MPCSQPDPNDEADAGFVDYGDRDREIVDYQFYQLPDAPGIGFRGPAIDNDDGADFFTCIGSAQTLGVLVEKPFPTLLSERLGLPVLNLGLGAACPGSFAAHNALIARANRGRFVVLQVMTARSEANSRFAPTAHVEKLRDRGTGEILPPLVAWTRMLEESPEQAARLAEESRRAWIESSLRLIGMLHVPVLLFWFAPRAPDEAIDAAAVGPAALLGRFPQLVDGVALAAVREACEGYAECRSERNAGHPLVSRFTGEPVEIDYARLQGLGFTTRETHNHTYPSPEMHEDATDSLQDVVSGLLRRSSGSRTGTDPLGLWRS